MFFKLICWSSFDFQVPGRMYEEYERKGYVKDRAAEVKAKTSKTPDPASTPKPPGRRMTWWYQFLNLYYSFAYCLHIVNLDLATRSCIITVTETCSNDFMLFHNLPSASSHIKGAKQSGYVLIDYFNGFYVYLTRSRSGILLKWSDLNMNGVSGSMEARSTRGGVTYRTWRRWALLMTLWVPTRNIKKAGRLISNSSPSPNSFTHSSTVTNHNV